MDTRCTRKVDGFPCRYELGHTQACDVDWARHYAQLEAKQIGSAKITRILEEARSLGLEVEVEVTEEDWPGGDTYRSVSATICRPRVEITNMLEQVQQSETIVVGWSWIVRNGVTPKMYHAVEYSLFTSGRKLTARTLGYAIRSMGEK